MAVEDRSTADGAVNSGTRTNYTSRGVFNQDGDTTTAGTGTSSTTSETIVGPSGGGGGVTPNDATITLTAGTGIEGGGDFTTNQATAETITFSLPNTFVPGTGQSAGTAIGTADNPIQSITIDPQGRVSSVTVQTATPLPDPFNDNFRSSSDNTPLRASESATTETVTLNTGTGYTLGNVVPNSAGTVPVTFGPIMGEGTGEVTFDVTIPATDEASDPTGPATVVVDTLVTETSSGRTMPETSTPLNRDVFIPFYQMTFDTQQTSLTLAGLTASSAALTNGTAITLPYNTGGPQTQYGYLALEMVSGRSYRFDAGFFDISTDPTGQTATMFGRTFEFFEFPTRADLSFTIRF